MKATSPNLGIKEQKAMFPVVSQSGSSRRSVEGKRRRTVVEDCFSYLSEKIFRSKG